MSMAQPPNPPSGTLWSSLVRYYRSCLEREQALDVRVPVEPTASVILQQLDEHLISRKAITSILTEPRHTQPVLAYLNRRGRGISGTFIYGYPLVRTVDGLIPLCYTEVRLEPGTAPQTVLLTRGNAELLVNRRLLLERAGLLDTEVNDLLRAIRSPKGKGPEDVLDRYLLDMEITYDAVLFASEAAPVTRASSRELQLMEQLRKDRLPEAIRMLIGEQAIPTNQPQADPLTVQPADPSQEAVLRKRRTPVVVAVGPAGSGKTQTAINLMASALAEGQRVLYISPDPTAADAVCERLNFPGTLRIGGRETRSQSLAAARQVLRSVRDFQYSSDDPVELARQSRQLGQEIARLDAQAQEVLRLEHQLSDLGELLRLVEQSLQHHPHRTWMEAMVSRITPELAALLRPEQLIGIRHLAARVAGWQPETGSISGRLRDMMRAQQIKSGLRQLGVPDFCHPDGDLPTQMAGLTRLEQAFPLLLARARLLHTTALRSRLGDQEAIRAGLAAQVEAKLALDRRRLQGAWLAVADRIRPNSDQLEAIIAQEEQMLANPAKASNQRRGRLGDLLSAFPAVVADRFTLSGILPNEPESFDLLIVDDASRVDLPAFLPVLYRAKRLCVLGDEHGPKPPTYLGAEEDSRLIDQVTQRNLAPYAYTEVSVLDRAMRSVGPDHILRLKRQHRSTPAIFGWCSQRFYRDEVELARQEPGTCSFEEVADGQVIYPASDALSQAQNPQEAMRAARLVTQLVAQGQSDLAVLSPFHGQTALIQTLLDRLAGAESDPSRAAALRAVPVAREAVPARRVILSLVAAQGATPELLAWLEQRRDSLLQQVAAAAEQLIVAGHRQSLTTGGPTLSSLVAYLDRFAKGNQRTEPTAGLQPERLGLLASESKLVHEWLQPPAQPEELFDEAERELYVKLAQQVAGRPVHTAPRLSLAQVLEPVLFAALTGEERSLAAETHLPVTLVHTSTLRPLVAIGLESVVGPQVEALCRKANLPLVRVRPGQWQLLRSALSLIPTK